MGMLLGGIAQFPKGLFNDVFTAKLLKDGFNYRLPDIMLMSFIKSEFCDIVLDISQKESQVTVLPKKSN